VQDFEKLGVFYLGSVVDSGRVTNEPLLYDSRDLLTHAVCLGMTGSGKTGLCVALLEEAAIDGIPAIVVDPKGDLGNLLLTFPDVAPASFRPWIDEAEAARQGTTADAFAASVAEKFRKGLEESGQEPKRIERFRSSVEAVIYTPGGSAGIPVSVLGSLRAPSDAAGREGDALRERVLGTASSLLVLLGVDPDPVRSREHILLSKILEEAWAKGEDLDLEALVRRIQSPPFGRVGILGLEAFFPAKDRADLATSFNNLLASPGFSAWLSGEPVDVARFLWTKEGKPRLSVFSIAHLSDAERMFFVTLLLSSIVAWMRAQPGTSSLRALFYMDEVFGYLPPTANPPCKTALLTLLKQARASGLGIVLATQNPVDLDYKALSNAGTWFLGRLQTERDKNRVLEGLEGVSGGALDRKRADALLSGLEGRRFLMHDVHEDGPVVFRSRQTLSYLRGPLTRAQIQALMSGRRESERAAAVTAGIPPDVPAPAAAPRPVLPPGIREVFVGPPRGSSAYAPALLGTCRVHYVDAKAGVDVWEEVALLTPLDEESRGDPWERAQPIDAGAAVPSPEPPTGASFAPLPPDAAQAKSYAEWRRDLSEFVYRERALSLYRHAGTKLVSKPGESRGDFVVRVRQAAREGRDDAVEAVRRKLQERIRRAHERVSREQAQLQQQSVQTAISLGATVLGALFGRKMTSTRTLGSATTAARGVGRAAREREDVASAREDEEALKRELEEIGAVGDAESGLQEISVRARKADTDVEDVVLAWVPRSGA
jgi:hypothetical protein